ncbi:MAG: hypothetical protein RR531_12820 [Longicatena sp.]
MIKVLKSSSIKSNEGYCKLPDGTLMCFGRIIYNIKEEQSYGSCKVNYPVKFVYLPNITITNIYSYSNSVFWNVGDDNGEGFSAHFQNKVNYKVGEHVDFFWMAIGRWK